MKSKGYDFLQNSADPLNFFVLEFEIRSRTLACLKPSVQTINKGPAQQQSGHDIINLTLTQPFINYTFIDLLTRLEDNMRFFRLKLKLHCCLRQLKCRKQHFMLEGFAPSRKLFCYIHCIFKCFILE